ncbi:MAG TPA: sugar ABC transporter permease [Chloroflexota bacterium]|nr:sugar ABC transporter permease [Chloroflexota bacterium]
MYKTERRKLIIPYLLPALILYTLFFTVPVLQSPYYSLTEWTGISEPAFVGLENYAKLIEDERWWMAVRNTVLYALMHGVIGLSLGLLFAVAIKNLRRSVRPIKFVVFMPSILPIAVIALLWLFIYNPQFGLLNGMLRMVGLGDWTKAWLGDNATVLPAITLAAIWAGLGGTMILFLAGLQKIPKEFYEAATIDGAGDWALFRHITWPLLWEITRIMIILSLIGGLQAFGLFYVISGGFLRDASQVTGTYLYMVAFKENRMGYATAIGVVLFAIIMVLTVVTNRVLRRETVEY